jgi:uracil-DNA glycosylase family 4
MPISSKSGPPNLSPYQLHVRQWCACTRCALAAHRHTVVLARGTVPAPVLFCGEAPGISENLLGKPFVGPAGKLLDHIIDGAPVTVPYALTNVVACIPKDAEGESKTAEPPREAVLACQPRLLEFVQLCRPRVLIAVGKVAEFYTYRILDQFSVERFAAIVHPAAILRASVMQRGLAIQRAMTIVADAVEGL